MDIKQQHIPVVDISLQYTILKNTVNLETNAKVSGSYV